MGFHVCEYDEPGKQYRFPSASSGDVTLVFKSGNSWQMPDMILHYVADHKWQPPSGFVDDVMNSIYVGGGRMQTKALATPIGYLSGPFKKGSVPDGFVARLEILIKQATREGDRIQYRSTK